MELTQRPGPRPIVRLLVPVAATLVLVSGCATLRDVPLPGVVSGPTFEVTADFANALGLPEQASVRFAGATVGEVASVRTVDYKAVVELKISERASIPADVRAEIRLSSPMGESFIELTEPAVAGRAASPDLLHDGSRIGLEATWEAPSATDLLASVSTLITGGSFADMKVILTELNTALTGRAPDVRRLIARLSSTLAGLNAHTAQFDRALGALDRTARQLAGDRALVGSALEAIPPALRTLNAQRQQILTLMARVRALSRVAVPTIARTRNSLSVVLRDLAPILDTLTRNEASFAPIFQGIHDFGHASDDAGYGLFANFDLTTIIDPTDLGLLSTLELANQQVSPRTAPKEGAR